MPDPTLDSVTKFAAQMLEWLATAPIELVGAFGLVGLGYMLKMTPHFPNNWIPFTIIASGIVLYPLVISPSRAPHDVEYPRFFLGIVGLFAGLGAWVFHRTLLRRWLDHKIFRADGDTEIITRPPQAGDSGKD